MPDVNINLIHNKERQCNALTSGGKFSTTTQPEGNNNQVTRALNKPTFSFTCGGEGETKSFSSHQVPLEDGCHAR